MSFYNKIHTKNEKAETIRRRRELVMRQEEEEMAMENASIKAKLEVSQPGDAQEQEADMIARKVVDGGDANISQLSPASSSVQSKSEGDTLRAPEGLQRQLDSSKGNGQSLPENVQQDIGGKMGADLSDVKIHTGSNAHEMADSVNAKAFTHGQDIYFKDGNYDPGSKGGKELLAHEVVHTQQNAGQAQQNQNGVGRKIQRQTDPKPLSELKNVFDSPMVWGIADSYRLVAATPLGKISVSNNFVGIQKNTAGQKAPSVAFDPEFSTRPINPVPMRNIRYSRQIKIEPQDGGEIYINVNATTAPAPLAGLDNLSEHQLLLVVGSGAMLEYEIKGINTEKKWFYTKGQFTSSSSSINNLIAGVSEADTQKLLHLVALNQEYIATATGVVQRMGGFTPIIRNDEDVQYMLGRRGNDVKKTGIVAQNEFKVKFTPIPRQEGIGELGYRFMVYQNERVSVTKEYNGWYFIQSGAKSGWVEEHALAFNPPEPNATLYTIEKGQTLSQLVKQYYSLRDKEDKRMYVNGVVYANRISGRLKQIKNTSSPGWFEENDQYHHDPILIKGMTIWMPSKEYIIELEKKGTISSGSYTGEIWKSVKKILESIWWGIQFGLAFVGGLVVGFLESIWDTIVAIYNLVAMPFKVLYSLFFGDGVQKAKEIWEFVSNLTWAQMKEIASAVVEEIGKEMSAFGEKLSSPDPWVSGYNWGWLIGYIIAEVIMAVVSWGSITAIKWGGKAVTWLSKVMTMVMKIVSKFTKMTKKMPGLGPLKKAFKKGIVPAKKVVTKTKKVVTQVKKITSKITPKTIKHIFEGEIKAGKATGVHHIDAIRGGTARIVPGTIKIGPKGVFKAIVEVKDAAGNWVRKTANGGYSSFFRPTWNKQKVLEEITHAFNNKIFVKGNTWLGTASDGTKIEMYLDKSGNIISAFPKF